MLICLGGILGSGRNQLARAIANRFGFYYYDMNQHRLRGRFLDSSGRAHEYLQRASTDDLRTNLYHRAVKDFLLLSKMHPDIVLNDGFHRSLPREYFFQEVPKYFDKVFFAWVESEDGDASQRITRLAETHHIESVSAGLKIREKMKREFQPFLNPPPVFRCTTFDDEKNLEDFVKFFKQETGVLLKQKSAAV